MTAKRSQPNSKDRRALAPGELARAHTYRLVVEYEGTRYSGWQEQKNARTVAGTLLAAFAEAGSEVLDLGGAGRTDAGVHALAQVAHLKLGRAVEPAQLLARVTERLPADVNVLSIERAPPRFHARHDAESRSYVYQLVRGRSAFAKAFAWSTASELDLAAMRAAQAMLVGERDFAPFGQETPAQTKTTVRMRGVEMIEHGAMVVVRFEASHFLWRMVRRMTGALVKVGTRAITVDDFAAIVAGGAPHARVGTVAEWTAPATGLFLERVRYPGDATLGPLAPAIAIASAANRAAEPRVWSARAAVEPEAN